jgi:hypothetical protein
VKRICSKILVPAALAGVLVSRGAEASVPLCVEVTASAPELTGFRKLVQSELARHPTHRIVETDCRSHLRVELFEAAGARFLTAQIDQEVPTRFAINGTVELGNRLEEAIRLVLHNDPVYLAEDIAHLSAVQRFGQSIVVRGRFIFRMELFETISRGGNNVVTVPGMALGLTRGWDHWQVLGRFYGGGSPTSVTGTDRALQAMAGVDGGLTYELFDKALWSPYVSGCAGVSFVRYIGREQAQSARISHVNDIGATLSARAGARFFRWYNFDLDLFAQGYLPLYVTKDVDGALFSEAGLYTPSLQIGLGVGF